jgi:mRNA interferase RelE/StbE
VSSDYRLIYHRDTVKFIVKQEKASQERITQGIKGLLVIPPFGDIKLMRGYPGLYRLRIGSYRVLFEVQHSDKIIYIQAIDFRGNIYK